MESERRSAFVPSTIWIIIPLTFGEKKTLPGLEAPVQEKN